MNRIINGKKNFNSFFQKTKQREGFFSARVFLKPNPPTAAAILAGPKSPSGSDSSRANRALSSSTQVHACVACAKC
ncbi:hypothetical protein E1A91_D06G031300v1 [Gossypium mustelinum]|uniref:Uncharacterized protein n=3 Tax=Gossypium TaxID=3633 RepID=A0A5J5QY86_GOSBA|nr:hypothetical protein ES319_D06G029700v1 [Gossypium barbadense]TYG63456.1 hypothetical protein ES288_D06G031600v1 [Gossypium darwinii]TYI75791.1 hypothetical protein E1A91_D06G031300v1 [Gossypium mustelinum]